MTDDRCPNCHAEGPIGDMPCRQCGWIPLQPTELRFVDAQMVTCPNCAQQRPIGDKVCSHCAEGEVLESLSRYADNFHISSLLLLTTAIAICFALMRVLLPLGIFAFIVMGLTTYRTALLVRERKRHRYPVAFGNVVRMAGMSVAGIILAMAIFAGINVLGWGLISIIFEIVPYLFVMVPILTLVVLTLAGEVAAIIKVAIGGQNRQTLLIGAVSASVCLLTPFVEAVGNSGEILLLLLLFTPLAIVIPASLFLVSRRGGTVRAKAFIVGFSAGLFALGGLGVLTFMGNPAWGSLVESIFGLYLASGTLLWPVLLTIRFLESIWSWDDAFPQITSPQIPTTNSRRSDPILNPETEGDQGVEFVSKSPEVGRHDTQDGGLSRTVDRPPESS